MSATCRSCGAEIIWAKMPSGKMNPIDAEPSEKGNVILYRHSGGKTTAKIHRPEEALLPGEKLRTSHFVTCPNAKSHRR